MKKTKKVKTKKVRIKFIGHGEVLRSALSSLCSVLAREKLEIEVYTRTGRPMNSPAFPPGLPVSLKSVLEFRNADGESGEPIECDEFIFYCASTNEKKLLRRSRSSGKAFDRMMVAKENLVIMRDLMALNIFARGKIFILTNPSELLAEYLHREVGNAHIYALGVHHDRIRYQEILGNLPDRSSEAAVSIPFKMLGLHYQSPIIQFESAEDTKRIMVLLQCQTPDETLSRLRKLFEEKVLSEFKGNRPPVQSGASNILGVLNAIIDGGKVGVSGLSGEMHSFLSGVFDVSTGTFNAHLGHGAFESQFIQDSIRNHHLLLNELASTPEAGP